MSIEIRHSTFTGTFPVDVWLYNRGDCLGIDFNKSKSQILLNGVSKSNARQMIRELQAFIDGTYNPSVSAPVDEGGWFDVNKRELPEIKKEVLCYYTIQKIEELKDAIKSRNIIQEEDKQEIERLKGLIEKEFKENNGWDMEKKEDGNYEMFQSRELKESEWKQFKTDNNL